MSLRAASKAADASVGLKKAAAKKQKEKNQSTAASEARAVHALVETAIRNVACSAGPATHGGAAPEARTTAPAACSHPVQGERTRHTQLDHTPVVAAAPASATVELGDMAAAPAAVQLRNKRKRTLHCPHCKKTYQQKKSLENHLTKYHPPAVDV